MLNLLDINHISFGLPSSVSSLLFVLTKRKSDMNKFYTLLIFACFHLTNGYNHGRLQYVSSHENQQELPQNTPNEYISYENFHNSRRSGRQSQFNYPSRGFSWDSDTDYPGRRPNNNQLRWNQENNYDPDSFIFEDDFDNRNNIIRTTQRIPTTRRRPTTQRTPSSTVAIPGMGTPRTPCEDRCLSTPEYNPVCGDDDMTYFSGHRLNCAQRCGKRVKLKHAGACSLIPPRG